MGWLKRECRALPGPDAPGTRPCRLPRGHALWHESDDGLSWGSSLWDHCVGCRVQLEPTNDPRVTRCPRCGSTSIDTAGMNLADLKGAFAGGPFSVNTDGSLSLPASAAEERHE